jgi:hypothetical protein
MFALDLSHGVLAAELDMAIIAEPSENPHLTLVQLVGSESNPWGGKIRVYLINFPSQSLLLQRSP